MYFTYDANGQRLTKTSGGVLHEYFYEGTRLLYETFGNNRLTYLYDESGNIEAFLYNGTKYYLVKNLQGDVVQLRNKYNQVVAHYTYNAFGYLLSVTDSAGNEITNATNIALINPIRYRGYYYDNETKWYYLNSRYYNPEMGRFVSADVLISTDIAGLNMFAYCGNDPVNYIDPDGMCKKFLGFLWKIDCKQASCPESKNYVEPKSIEPTGTYNNGGGYVYIVTEEQLDAMENREENVVVIVDYRTNNNADMKIIESYKINKTKHQKGIAQLMIDYDRDNPANEWNRSKDSIVEEWKLHNFVYRIGLFHSSTADCDFDKNDEGKGFFDFFVDRVLR